MPASRDAAAASRSLSKVVSDSNAPAGASALAGFQPTSAPAVSSRETALTRVIMIGTVAVTMSRLLSPTEKLNGKRRASDSMRVRRFPALNRNVPSPVSDRAAASAVVSVGSRVLPRLSALKYVPSGIRVPDRSKNSEWLIQRGSNPTRNVPRGTRNGSGSWAEAVPAVPAVKAVKAVKAVRADTAVPRAAKAARNLTHSERDRGDIGGQI